MASRRVVAFRPHLQPWQYALPRLRVYPAARYSRHASTTAPETDKSRILEKPAKFNPPSHGNRRARPRHYGPRLSEEEKAAQSKKRYPNMMPPEGTFWFNFLTDRRLHLMITMGTLLALGIFASWASFLHSCVYRDELPSAGDFWKRPFSSIDKFVRTYKKHVEYQSGLVAEKRAANIEDARKRQEFLREHGVDPGFLTGTWMDKFGTVEGDKWKADRAAAAAAAAAKQQEEEEQHHENGDVMDGAVRPVMDGAVGAPVGERFGATEADSEASHPRERPKRKLWLGIW